MTIPNGNYPAHVAIPAFAGGQRFSGGAKMLNQEPYPHGTKCLVPVVTICDGGTEIWRYDTTRFLYRDAARYYYSAGPHEERWYTYDPLTPA
jgi:hypothetical protein